jgi:hypothetical protein
MGEGRASGVTLGRRPREGRFWQAGRRRQRPERCGLAPLTRAKEETWTGKFEGVKQGAERTGMIAFGFEGGAAVRAG